MEGFLWPVTMFLSIVGIVGLPGNILIILVYVRRPQTRSYHVFILTLAVADLIVCLLIPVTVHHWHIYFDYDSRLLCRLAIAVDYVTVNNSCFMTSAIAVDRYLAICRPLRRWMTVRCAKLTALLCSVAAVIVSTPVVAAHDVVFADGGGNGTGSCTLSPYTPAWVMYLTYTPQYVSCLTALAVCVILYGKVYRTIRKQARWRPEQVAASAPTAGRSSRNLFLRPMMSKNAISASPREPVLAVASLSCNYRLSVSASREHNQQHQHRSQIQRAPQTEAPSEQIQQQVLERAPATEGHAAPAPEGRTIRPTGAWVHEGTNNDPMGGGRQQFAQAAEKFQRSTTRMLAVTSAVFLFTWVLSLCLLSVKITWHGTCMDCVKPAKDNEVGAALRFFFINIVYLNNAINPFIYGFMNRRFRTDCANVITVLRCRYHSQTRPDQTRPD